MKQESSKLLLFTETLVSNYRERRKNFLGSHMHRLGWFLKRFQPSTHHREKEYWRILKEQLSFLLEENDEIRGISDLARAEKETVRKVIVVLNTHISTLKYRSDFLTLALAMFGLLLSGGMAMWKADPHFWPGILVPPVILGLVVVLEKHFFLEKIYMYEELVQLLKYKLES